MSDSGDDRIPAGVSGCLRVGAARRLEREKDGQTPRPGPSLSGSGPGEKTDEEEGVCREEEGNKGRGEVQG